MRHLAPRCVLRLAVVAQWQKGESPTCKCGDWCFLSWSLQCGSYQDLLIPTLGLRSPFLILIFLARRREHRWWWEWLRWWQSQERTVEKWPPKAVDSQSVPWAGAHSQPSEDRSLLFFLPLTRTTSRNPKWVPALWILDRCYLCFSYYSFSSFICFPLLYLCLFKIVACRYKSSLKGVEEQVGSKFQLDLNERRLLSATWK